MSNKLHRHPLLSLHQFLWHRITYLVKLTLLKTSQVLRGNRLPVHLDIKNPPPVVIPPIRTKDRIPRITLHLHHKRKSTPVLCSPPLTPMLFPCPHIIPPKRSVP